MMQLVTGLFLGATALEFVIYFWHRFVEHGEFGLEARHVIHHTVLYPAGSRPTEKYLNAWAWSWAIPIIGISALSMAVLPQWLAIGTVSGGLAYAWLLLKVHGLFHVKNHRLWAHGWWHRLANRHELHHEHGCNYGILLFSMDRLFGTFRA